MTAARSTRVRRGDFMGWTSLASEREAGLSTPRRPTPDRRPRRTNDGALAHDPVLRLAAWLRSTPLRARRPKAAYGCGSAPVSDRLPQTAGVKWSNAPTCTAEQSSRPYSGRVGQHCGELVNHPVQVCRLNRDRRGQTHGRSVSVLGKDSLGQKAFAHLAAGHQRRVDVDPGPQATRSDGDDTVTDKGLKTEPKLLAEHPGALLVLPRGQKLDDRAAHRRSQRVAAEGRAVVARLDDSQDLLERDHRGDRHDAAAERLAQDVHVRHHVLEFACEGGSGATKP